MAQRDVEPKSLRRADLGYLSLIDLGELPKQVDPLLIFRCNFSIRRSALVEAGASTQMASQNN